MTVARLHKITTIIILVAAAATMATALHSCENNDFSGRPPDAYS